jgi:RNA polymerase sigma-70 factor (ECF subfamily)
MVNIMEAVLLMEGEKSDREMFSRMAREHHRMLLAYAQTLLRDEEEARELVQDSLLAAWKSLGRFDVTRETGAWLRGIVRNKWRDHCRRRGRRPECENGNLEELEADLAGWETQQRRPLFEALDECCRKLPQALRKVVQLFYFDDLRGGEVAAALKVNAATVRKRLERARAALHQCLQSEL